MGHAGSLLALIVIVSGAPGAGKTTLARPLAAALGFCLLSKDDVKETLFDAVGGQAGDVPFSHLIGGAAMEILWKLAAYCPRVRSDFQLGRCDPATIRPTHLINSAMPSGPNMTAPCGWAISSKSIRLGRWK
ncbi:MAG TPA: AAA family ATPase [Candidatus Xenobia bacterium]